MATSSTDCGDEAPQALRVLYEDKELGFQVLAHINEKARVSPPHDHGASWAIYGQATQYTDMTEWERVDGGSGPGPRGAAAEEEVSPYTRPCRHLPGWRYPFDRLSAEIPLHPRDRHKPRPDSPRQVSTSRPGR